MNPSIITITPDMAGQRLDNFLTARLKGVPKTRIHRAIRSGEVRINRKRVKFAYRLQAGDAVRIPPLRSAAAQAELPPNQKLMLELEQRILIEDSEILIINKPSGLSVQGGDEHWGLIDTMRLMRPRDPALKLAHRLDRETSGCLMLAKKRQPLLALHALLKERKIYKQYLALVQGEWVGGEKRVSAPLLKEYLHTGGWQVKVHPEGKPSVSIFRPLKHFKTATLVEIILLTGRTHQARVHAMHLGCPIAGDGKYGNWRFNHEMTQLGLNRLFLHSAGLQFQLGQRTVGVCAILDNRLRNCLDHLEQL